MNAPLTLQDRQRGFASLPPHEQLQQIEGTRAEREFELERAGADVASRTVWMSIASERPYERWWGEETLDISKKSIRSERLDAGMPILVDHAATDLVGVIERWEISGGKLRVLARFGNSQRAQEVFQDVLDGIRRSTSIGYQIHKAVLTEKGTDLNKYRVTDWEPLEGSLVSVPADPSVGPGRSMLPQRKGAKMPDGTGAETKEETSREDAMIVDLQTSDAAARADERRRIAKRNAEILAVGEMWPEYDGPALAKKAVGDPNITPEAFKSSMLKLLGERMRGSNVGRVEPQPNNRDGRQPYGMSPREMIAATSLRAFSGIGKILGMEDREVAYRAGMWCMSVIHGNPNTIRWCRDAGVQLLQGSPDQLGFEERTLTDGVFTSAGWLVPVELEAAIISNREQYGVMRRICNVIPMTVASTSIPRITGDTTAYFVGEGTSGTTSDPAGDQVTLTLKDLMAWTNIGKSTAQDTVIALAEMVAREQARAFSMKEDACAINGDGTSTYGGMRGLITLLQDSNYSGGTYTAAAAHDTFAEIDVSDVTGLIGLLPIYARTGARWLASGVADAMMFGRLKLNAGGNDVQTVQGQIVEGSYAGFPITLDQYMPAGGATDYTNLVMLIIGNFQLGVAFGSGSGMMMTTDPYTYAHQNLTRIITSERIDIVCHGVNKSTTVAGPIVGLIGGT